MAPLSLTQRVWLQAMLSHGVVSQEHAKALHQRACQITRVDFRPNCLPDILEEVRKHLSNVGIDIRQARDELSGTNLIMVVNVKGDELAQMATTHTATEIAVIKKIFERIFTSDDVYSIASTEALKIGRQCKPALGSADTENLLRVLVQEGWLRYNRNTGRYALSSRSTMELNVYLKNAHPRHYFSCVVCEDLITNGYSCSQTQCKIRVHKHCRAPFERQIGISSRQQGQAPKCKGCHYTWIPSPVGEEPVRSRATRRARSASDQEHDDEDELEVGSPLHKQQRTTDDDLRDDSGPQQERRMATLDEEDEAGVTRRTRQGDEEDVDKGEQIDDQEEDDEEE